MKLPRRVVRSILASMVLLNLVLRYPSTPHEMGVDSFFIHNLATNIAVDGYAEWILNPLSLFGWYPLSYPSGGPILIADFSQVGGIPIEAAILLLSLAFGAFGVGSAFVMAREFRDDDLFCLSATFLYAFAPRFLTFTLWSASTRSLFMVLLPVFIWILLRTYREPKVTHFSLILVIFLLLAATHRLAALLAVVMVAFIASLLVLTVLRIFRIRAPRVALTAQYRRLAPFLALGTFVGIVGGMLFATDILSEYSTGELLSGTTPDVQLVNLGVSLGRSVGLGLLFAIPGVVVLVRAKNKTLREPFLVLSFLGLTPTLFLRQYTGFYILPFIALFGALTMIALVRLRRPAIRRAAVAVLFAGTLAFSSVLLDYEVEQATWMPTALYSTSLYADYYVVDANLVSNDGLVGIRIASICGCPYLPVGGAGTTFQSPELLAFGFFDPREVEANTVRIPLQDLTLESDSPWIASAIQAEADWVQILQSPFDGRGSIFRRYDPSFYLENEYHRGKFFAYGNQYVSAYAMSVYAGAYKFYDADTETIWYVAAPRS